MCPSKAKKKSPPSKSPPKKTAKSSVKSTSSKAAKKVPPPKTAKSSAKSTKKSPPPKIAKSSAKSTKKSPPPKVSKPTSKSSSSSKSNHSKPSPATKNVKKTTVPIKAAERNAEKEKQEQAKKRNYSEIDTAVYTLVNDKHSVLLEFLESHLELTEDETKKAVKRLEVKGKIKSERVMEGGKWMTRVEAIDNYGMDSNPQTKKNTQEFVWNTHGDLPCFLCPLTRKCGQGQESLNPEKCPDLTGWMDAKLNKKDYKSRFKNQAVEDGKTPPPVPPAANGATPPATPSNPPPK